jgi:hypothetical protein
MIIVGFKSALMTPSTSGSPDALEDRNLNTDQNNPNDPG